MNTTKLFPQVGVRARTALAAAVWAVGAFMVLRLAIGFIGQVKWVWWVLILGLLLGLAKSRFIMDKTAQRTLERLRARPRDWLLNLYAPRTWAILAGMIVLGIILRTFGPTDNTAYRHFLAVLYLTVGLGLALSDLRYWASLFTSHE